jgi:RNA polymerase sigma-70 factor (sigma-E family)
MERRLDRDEEFRRFTRRFLPTLLRGAYFLVRDVDLAEDVVQETMLRVFRHWDQARSAPEAYSRQTMLNVSREHWRRVSRRPREVSHLSGVERGYDESFTRGVAWRLELADAFRALPELQREVLVLRFLFDLSVGETSEVLGVSAGTVKSSAHRGLEKLRGLLTIAKEGTPC